ncbi:MAG: hypothetical protein KAY82_02125 [Hylemonella sp.]|nr:hypothetical protein [Hylemonella sp.]
MTSTAPESILQELARFPGIDGCALVEIDTGMVWYHAGSLPDVDRIAEAAVEFWRIQIRLSSNFSTMGKLQSAAYSFSQQVVALFPCSETPPLVLICIAQKTNVVWSEWGAQVQTLKLALQTRGANAVKAT